MAEGGPAPSPASAWGQPGCSSPRSSGKSTEEAGSGSLTPSQRAPLSDFRGCKQLQCKETLIHRPEDRLRPGDLSVLPHPPARIDHYPRQGCQATVTLTIGAHCASPSRFRRGAGPPDPARCGPCPSHSCSSHR